MKKSIKALVQGWSPARILRLVLGVAVAIQGMANKEWILAAAGLVLAAMAIARQGCDTAGACALSQKKLNKRTVKK